MLLSSIAQIGKELAENYAEKLVNIKEIAPSTLESFVKNDIVTEKLNIIKNMFPEQLMEYMENNIKECKVEYCLPKNDGHWENERGDSEWKPDKEYVPQKHNPEGKTWGEILEEYGIEGIEFNDGEPDFSPVIVEKDGIKAEVEIDKFTEIRPRNFQQADEKLAEKYGCPKEEINKIRKEIEKWREENNYTWHECSDCKTLQLVPREIHANIAHDGGVCEYKKNNEVK